MLRLPPRSTRPATPFPYTPPFRSALPCSPRSPQTTQQPQGQELSRLPPSRFLQRFQEFSARLSRVRCAVAISEMQNPRPAVDRLLLELGIVLDEIGRAHV